MAVVAIFAFSGCAVKLGDGDFRYEQKLGFVNADGNQLGGEKTSAQQVASTTEAYKDGVVNILRDIDGK